MSIATNFSRLQAEVSAAKAALVAVVKQRSVAEIQELITAGATDLGFGTVQDAAEKLPQLQFAGTTHLIGRLQKNKVRKAVELFDVIQSVDSLALATRIDRIAFEEGRPVRMLLQVNIAADPAKVGFAVDELRAALPRLAALKYTPVCGLMTIGRWGADADETTQEFIALKRLFDELRQQHCFGPQFTGLSMGMSDDYQLGLQTGATIVRIGSALFA